MGLNTLLKHMDGIPHSDYLIFVDESGEHGLVTLDKVLHGDGTGEPDQKRGGR
jgi:hypothetical protein